MADIIILLCSVTQTPVWPYKKHFRQNICCKCHCEFKILYLFMKNTLLHGIIVVNRL